MSEELKEYFNETPTPTLTFGEPDVRLANEKPVAINQKNELAESELSEEEQRMVVEFSEKIDLTNTSAILQYGATTQSKMAEFSERALSNVKSKDMGEIGNMIASLTTELKSIEIEEDDNKLISFFKKKANSVTALKAKYEKAEVNVQKITDALEDHQVQLMKDVDLLDKMYDMNLTYFKEISMYILAGKQKLENAKNTELVELKNKAASSGLPEDAQKVRDYENMLERFEKKISDLELSRMIALQTAPQLRLVQSSNTVMIEKIQSTIVNTIPLWKNQMVIALGIEHSTQAAEAQKQVSEMTNELLKKNAAALKTATIETAKESERGIVDIQTLKNTNESLISTLDEVVRIQSDGRIKRQQAEIELQNMENQLKEKLLNMAK